MQASEKQTLLERLKESHLLFEEFNLSGRIIIIHETTGHTSRRIGEMVVAIEGDPDLSEGIKDSLFTLYIPCMACSEGDLPKSYDEFLWLKSEDIEQWVKKARKMNPKIFSLLEQERRLTVYLDRQEQAKKKSRNTRTKRPKPLKSKKSS